MNSIEPTTIGLSLDAHAKLTVLKDDGLFPNMLDAYKLAIALALASDIQPKTITGERTTMFNIGSLDPEKTLYNALRSLLGEVDGSVYKIAEQLAEWGINEIHSRHENGDFSWETLLADNLSNK